MSVNATGLVADGEGLVGHAELRPAPAPWNPATGQRLAAHPQSALLGGVYTRLAGRDVFNTGNGSEAALSAHAPPFAGHNAAPGLSAFGVTGPFFVSFRNLALNVDAPADYTYDPTTQIERRVYRDGEAEFHHDPGPGPQRFARSGGIIMEVVINWNTFQSSSAWMDSVPDTGAGMRAIVVSSTGASANPVNESGTTTEGAPFSGRFGLYNTDATYEFAAVPAAATNLALDWFTVDTGGGSSAGAVYVVTGTAGQPDAGAELVGGSLAVQGGFWSVIEIVQTPGAPLLQLLRAGGAVTVFWDGAATGFVLQATSSLTPPIQWQTVNGVSNNTFAVPANPGRQFYRLRGP